ncbi:harpin-induced protein-related HIN1-related harpin-responsive protein-related [Musa troglodytarum]|uniref:Harpin-induced protein-related HIN1-related harpin-responsive protein-related n=1 Tax=Musa troglodytarum TaxID=320322 RepID=A0A9E7JW65_9LILI|nr:harpin-induced protein-related HIN1-related harpin-responsive protein-related [Musa troglodytarum]
MTPDNPAVALTTAVPSSQPATLPWRQGSMRCVAITALVLIVLVGLVVLVFWLALRPKPIEYSIDDARIRGFNIKAHALNAVFDLRLRSYNRNTRVSVYYDAMEVTVWYGGQMVAISKVAPFYQPSHYVQTITVSATAQSTPLLRPVEKNLARNESAGEVELEVRARARTRFVVGAVKKHYKLQAYCAPVVVRCVPRSHFDRVDCTSATLVSV